MKKKLKIGVLFGGKSAEHEVSLQSAKNVIEMLDKSKYEVIPIGIDKTGKWLLNSTSDYLLNSDDVKFVKLGKSQKEVALYADNRGELVSTNGKSSNKIDVIIPMLHGPFGEDGSVQGLLKLAGIPFIGAGVLGSAVSMDKDVMKRLLRDAGMTVGKFLVFKVGENINFKEIKNYLGMPVFIKPANLGSSVGISKAKNEKEFKRAIQEAFKYDRKIIIEEFIDGREFAVAVLGNEKPLASILCEIITDREFYDYEAKYSNEHGAFIDIPAKISKKLNSKAQKIAIEAYQTLNCEGMARIDLFLKKKNHQFVVCEINTIPGFTSHSMYPKLWEATGVPLSKLLDRLIDLAIERFNKERKLKTSFK
ncbi:MAG: D-alanine--D-alanine ligase [Candidatus Paceibacterota bacterium]|jgi:D-alanine-D-alanine ligase